jgi:NTE family protein
VLPPPCPLSITPIDFGHADELIGRALDDTLGFLNGGGEERAPIRMHMHRHRIASKVRPGPQPTLTPQ